MTNLNLSFPEGVIPRKSQELILSSIQKALANNKKFIVIQAPTGSGKSHIAATLSNVSRSPTQRFIDIAEAHDLQKKSGVGTYVYEDELSEMKTFGCAVMTVTKALQNQYEGLFTNADILKGKTNYTCQVDEDFDCDLSPCTLTPKLLQQCKQLNKCPYLNAKRDAVISKFSVYNYSAFLTQPKFLQRKQFFVCDEASELEDELVKYYSCEISYKYIKFESLGINKLLSTDRPEAFKWITDLLVTLKRKCDTMQEIFQKNKDNKRKLISTLNQLRLFRNIYEKMLTVSQNWHNTEYIVEIDGSSAKFTPLNVNMLASNFFNCADIVILMSGTIIDHATFTKTLGITDYEYIEVDSEFDPKTSPIYCLEKYKLNHSNLTQHLPALTTLALKVCDQYPKDKGIIHTHTFKITESLIKAVKTKGRFLAREPGVTNEFLVNAHKMSGDATVLISPSLGFGTDLADEFGRFSIIMKTPYLPLGDKRIKTLAERDWKWYQMRALVNLVQMCGRTTRSKDDHSDTFILDGTAVDLIKRNTNLLPKYFKDRIV
jgi:ATP-dependent DNA helicase DinG